MVNNRVFKVLVTTGTAAANVAALTAGKFVVLKKDGTAFSAADTITQGDAFKVAVGAPDGSVVFSDLLHLKDITAYQKTAYAARVEQVIDITLGTPVVGQEYEVGLINLSDKEILQRRQNKLVYSEIAATGETATTLAAKFVVDINADPAAFVVATSSGADITLTAKASETTVNIVGQYGQQVFFDAYCSVSDPNYYLTKFGTVVYTTAAGFGSGNYDQIKSLEGQAQGYIGVTNRRLFPIETGQYLSVLGTTYDTYIIEASRTFDSNSATFGKVSAPVSLIIACTSGAGSTLESILSPLIASAPNEALSVVA